MIPSRLARLGAFARAGSFGCSVLLLGSTSAWAADATFTTLTSFETALGAPVGKPVWGAGSVYGLTRIGTTTAAVLYRLDPGTGAVSVVHNFPETAANGITNHYPLILGKDGALYGTRSASVVATPEAGDEAQVGQLIRLPLSGDGAGVVTLKPLKSADGKGFAPASPLVQAADGTLYSATYNELFKVQPDGSGADVFFSEARWYATGVVGISGTQVIAPASGGSISGITLDTKVRTQIASGTSISTPTGLFARTADGTFYGTDKSTRVFKMTDQADSQQVLYTFTPVGTDYPNGNQPLNYLALGYDGKLYGVTNVGGTNNKGVVYSIDPAAADPAASFVKLHDFGSGSDGAYPTGIIQGKDGKLYGTTSREGTNGVGTLFSIDAGIEPPAPAVSSFTATPATVTIGDGSTLAWESQNTASCRVAATNFESEAQTGNGSLVVTPVAIGSIEYTLSCTGTGDFADESVTQTVTVTVQSKPPVVDSFTATPATITLEDSTQFAWTSSETSACRITDSAGYTSAALAAAGSLSVTPTRAGALTYTLSCNGNGSAAEQTATRTVSVQVNEKSGGGGGALSPSMLLALASLLMLRRRNRHS